MRRLVNTLAVFLIFSRLAACHDNGGKEPEESRVLVVYMGGDFNNLSSETYQKIEAIRQGWTGRGGEVVIYQDPEDQSPRLLRLNGNGKAGEATLQVLETYPEESHASAQVFARVINYTIDTYRADSYGLLIFSHATGWLPRGAMTTRSIFSDGREDRKNPEEMEIADFARAVPAGIFDFIILEACYTAGIEIAYELRYKCDYILASSAEIISPGFTDIYTDNIMRLFNVKAGVENALIAFGNSYGDYVEQGGLWGAGTLSLIKTSELDNLAAVSRSVLSGRFDDEGLDLESMQRFDRPSTLKPRFFDLRQYLEVKSPALSPQIAAAFGKCVPWSYDSGEFLNDGRNRGFAITDHSGITTYIPNDHYPELNKSYKDTAWYKALSE